MATRWRYRWPVLVGAVLGAVVGLVQISADDPETQQMVADGLIRSYIIGRMVGGMLFFMALAAIAVFIRNLMASD